MMTTADGESSGLIDEVEKEDVVAGEFTGGTESDGEETAASSSVAVGGADKYLERMRRLRCLHTRRVDRCCEYFGTNKGECFV